MSQTSKKQRNSQEGVVKSEVIDMIEEEKVDQVAMKEEEQKEVTIDLSYIIKCLQQQLLIIYMSKQRRLLRKTNSIKNIKDNEKDKNPTEIGYSNKLLKPQSSQNQFNNFEDIKSENLIKDVKPRSGSNKIRIMKTSTNKINRETQEIQQQYNIKSPRIRENTLNPNIIFMYIINKSTYINNERTVRGEDWYIKTIQNEKFKILFQIYINELFKNNQISGQMDGKMFFKLQKWMKNKIEFGDNLQTLNQKCNHKQYNINVMIETRIKKLEQQKKQLANIF